MLRKYLSIYGRPLLLFVYAGAVYSWSPAHLRRNWKRMGKRFPALSLKLKLLKKAYKAFSNKVGIKVALKSPPKFPHLSFDRLRGSEFAARVAEGKFIELRWPAEYEHLMMALRSAGSNSWAGGRETIISLAGLVSRLQKRAFASSVAQAKLIVLRCSSEFERLLMAFSSAGSKAWAWKMKVAIPLAGLVIFGYWFGSLAREFSVPPPVLVRLPIPPQVAKPGTDLLSWVDVPRPMIIIRPEVVHQPLPVPEIPRPEVTSKPAAPKLSVTQIFARLDRGEISLLESRVLLAAKSSLLSWESIQIDSPED